MKPRLDRRGRREKQQDLAKKKKRQQDKGTADKRGCTQRNHKKQKKHRCNRE